MKRLTGKGANISPPFWNAAYCSPAMCCNVRGDLLFSNVEHFAFIFKCMFFYCMSLSKRTIQEAYNKRCMVRKLNHIKKDHK